MALSPQQAATCRRSTQVGLLSMAQRQSLCLAAPAGGFLPSHIVARRYIKTLRTRSMVKFEMPMEFRMYQRFTTNPSKFSGPQFNTHFGHQHRKYDPRAFVDYLHWGKTLGQAHMPQRHQRVAFDFNDTMNPTRLPRGVTEPWAAAGGESGLSASAASASFDPNEQWFCDPVHYNTMYNRYGLATVGDIRLPKGFDYSLQKAYFTSTDTGTSAEFGNSLMDQETGGMQLSMGRVPGIHVPFLGEPDSRMMLAMAQPIRGSDNKVTFSRHRYSHSLYLNTPQRANALLDGEHALILANAIDRSANAIRAKVVVLTAAQCGVTDYFCAGADLEVLAFNCEMAYFLAQKAQARLHTSAGLPKHLKKEADVEAVKLQDTARQHQEAADSLLRNSLSLVFRAFITTHPLITLINGKCRNVGNGLALLTKYPGLRDSSEFAHEGPQWGITPFGGLTHLLAREETALKYPGLAEYVMMTGFPLYSGDALRLGWSDLFATLPDLGYHIKQWFDDSEHLHQDAVAWQLGHMIETCFTPDPRNHSAAMERTAITPVRARWIEDAFADQPTVEAIMNTLTQIEKLPPQDSSNNHDDNSMSIRASLDSIAAGVQKLEQTKMHFTLNPWDLSAPPEEIEVMQVSDIFRSYYFESMPVTVAQKTPAGRRQPQLLNRTIVARHDVQKLRRWQEFRLNEYKQFQRTKLFGKTTRHLFVRLEGCEGRFADFEFTFDKKSADKEAKEAGLSTEAVAYAAQLRRLRTACVDALGLASSREVQVHWCLPNFDTAVIRTDDEIAKLLHADPGVEDPQRPTKFPPLYLAVARATISFSEWAFSVKHQLLLLAPHAVKASFALLRHVRGDGSASGGVKSVAETLSAEFRVAARSMQRPDFWRVGIRCNRPADEWEAERQKQEAGVHETVAPLRPVVPYDEVFERDVTIDGHRFILRPRWEPRLIEEVRDADVHHLLAPLDMAVDKTVDFAPQVETNSAESVASTVFDVIGYEVVARLGDKPAQKEKSGSLPIPQPWQSDAVAPDNVNFYEMARHPWMDQPHSWRTDGFTDGSMQYFRKKYDEAVKAVHDPGNEGGDQHLYWPKATDAATTQVKAAAPPVDAEAALLQSRFWAPVKAAQSSVEPWAKNLREKAESESLGYRIEVTTTAEKVFDDEYYRWFVRPGEHPNPSGVLKPAGQQSTVAAKSDEK